MDAGRVQVGTSVGVPANVIIADPWGEGGTKLTVFYQRNVNVYELRYGTRSEDYRIGYAEIFLDRNGRGQGTFIPAARVRLRDGNTWEVEDFGVLPARLMGLRSSGVRESARQAVKSLHDMGIETVMLTGDNRHTAQAVARELGMDTVTAEVLLEDKANEVMRLQRKGRKVCDFIRSQVSARKRHRSSPLAHDRHRRLPRRANPPCLPTAGVGGRLRRVISARESKTTRGRRPQLGRC